MARAAPLWIWVACGTLLAAASCDRFPQRPAAAPPASPSRSDAAAEALWQRAQAAPRSAPLRAHVVITRWEDPDSPPRVSVLNVVEGTGGRFRHEYVAPASARGRVVVCDGRTVWQYEPRTQTVLRHPAAENSDASVLPDPMGGSGQPRIEPGAAARVAGRPAQVLVFSHSGRVVERRWIDAATGRSLRAESYEPGGRLLRRVEMTAVTFAPAVSDAVFRAAFPPTARVIDGTAERSVDAAGEARRLRLPARAGDFRLRSVVRPRRGSARLTDAETHLLYSNGARSLSVFVTEQAGGAAVFRPAAGWRSISLGEGRAGYAREEGRGRRAAVAWTGARGRYIAVAHLPLSDLLPLTRALAAGPVAD